MLRTTPLATLDIDFKDFGSPDDVYELLWAYESRKLDQLTAEYNPLGATAEQACSNCQWFIGPDKCLLVYDWPHPITPNGWSNQWSKRVIPEELMKARFEPFKAAHLSRRKKPIKKDDDEDKDDKKAATGFKGMFERIFGNLFADGDAVFAPPAAPFMFKEVNGETWWLASVTNNFRDVDTPPEIFSDASHREFMGYLDLGGQMPELWAWHTPGTRWGKAKVAGYDDGIFWYAGTVDKGREKIAEAFAKDANGLKVSHGYNEFSYSDRARGIIGKYRTFEISPLPAGKEANPLTSFAIIGKEAGSMKIGTEKRQFLEGKGYTATELDGFEKSMTDMASAARALGIESKDLNDPDPDPTPNPTPEPEPAPATTPTGQATTDVEALVKAFGESPTMKGITDAVTSLGDRMTAIEQASAKGVADEVDKTVAARVLNGAPRPSQSDANVVNKEGADDRPGPMLGVDPVLMSGINNTQPNP